jgi:hypothetical protein
MNSISELDRQVTVHSFSELMGLVHLFRKDGGWIFRGVSRESYDLKPRIGRDGARRGVGSPDYLPFDRGAEDTMIQHFIRSAGPYVRHKPSTLLEWLALAQHHGMATRLLDWTGSLLVAAFFAVDDARNLSESPLIYCVKDIPVVPIDKHDSPDYLDDVMLYYPPHVSPRIPAQSGVFTVHNEPDRIFQSDKIKRIKINQSRLTFKLDLNACGIHRASLFPDIDGLAEHQTWLYKWGEHMRYD